MLRTWYFSYSLFFRVMSEIEKYLVDTIKFLLTIQVKLNTIFRVNSIYKSLKKFESLALFSMTFLCSGWIEVFKLIFCMYFIRSYVLRLTVIDLCFISEFCLVRLQDNVFSTKMYLHCNLEETEIRKIVLYLFEKHLPAGRKTLHYIYIME